MRLIRGLTTGLASLALLPAIGHAQEGRLFNNSWFWGVSGGVMTYWTTNVAHAQAPTVGIEWLMTQKHTALYIGIDQSIFKTSGVNFTNVGHQFNDSTLTTGSDWAFGQAATVHDSRQINVALMGFPGSGPIRPYVGLGVSFNFVQNAIITGAYPTSSGAPAGNSADWFPSFYNNQFLDQSAYWVSPMLMAGLQIQVSRISIFGQGKVMTTDSRHLFNNAAFFTLQAGVRYNVAGI